MRPRTYLCYQPEQKRRNGCSVNRFIAGKQTKKRAGEHHGQRETSRDLSIAMSGHAMLAWFSPVRLSSQGLGISRRRECFLRRIVVDLLGLGGLLALKRHDDGQMGALCFRRPQWPRSGSRLHRPSLFVSAQVTLAHREYGHAGKAHGQARGTHRIERSEKYAQETPRVQAYR